MALSELLSSLPRNYIVRNLCGWVFLRVISWLAHSVHGLQCRALYVRHAKLFSFNLIFLLCSLTDFHLGVVSSLESHPSSPIFYCGDFEVWKDHPCGRHQRIVSLSFVPVFLSSGEFESCRTCWDFSLSCLARCFWSPCGRTSWQGQGSLKGVIPWKT